MAMTLSEALASGTASKCDTLDMIELGLFKNQVNKVSNCHRVVIPGIELAKSMRVRSQYCTVHFGKAWNKCGIIGASMRTFGIESAQIGCITRAKYCSVLPQMALVIGAPQGTAFNQQNNVGMKPTSRTFAAKRSEVEGVVPLSNFPGWYQPRNGEVHSGGKRQVPSLLYNHARITLGANNIGEDKEEETKQEEHHLVPIGASVSAWEKASDVQKNEWHNGIYRDVLRAKQIQMKRFKRGQLWKIRFHRTEDGEKNTTGGLHCVTSHLWRHVENPTAGTMTRMI